MNNIKIPEGFSQQYKEAVNILTPCMDDYLYIMDLQEDTYWISETALERFAIPCNYLENATQAISQFTHPDDFSLLLEDIACIMNKEKDFHNLQYRWMDRNGRTIWINCRGRILFDDEKNPKYLVGCINEIGKTQMADNVSGLLGDFVLQRELREMGADRQTGFIMRLGIDDFKEINENKGMEYGDFVLMKTAGALGKAISENQQLYKVVGDEYAVVDFNSTNRNDAAVLYQRICDEIKAYFEENDYEVFFTVSAGIVYFADVKDQSADTFMKLSEFALSEAKESGKNKACGYDENRYGAFLRRKELQRDLQLAVSGGFDAFETFFQPVVDIRENRLIGAEALLRFKKNEAYISPFFFVPLLEETGLIIPVGKWVLKQVAEACQRIRQFTPDFRISVNLSYIQVLKSNVLEDIISSIEAFDLPQGSIIVELTESGFFESDENFLAFCKGLKEHGIQMALDDFGTGYSNFHYLYELSPEIIKIDRTFTVKALENEYEFNLLKYMAELAHNINLNLCIEGIEEKEELERICAVNPDYIQGYYFGKPVSLEAFMEAHVLTDKWRNGGIK